MIRVLVVAEVCIYREGLASIVGKHPGVSVVGSAQDAATALRAISELEVHPDVVLVDVSVADGLSLVCRLATSLPQVRIVTLAVPRREDEILTYIEAGAAGYVTRDASSDELAAVVERAARGEALCSPELTGALLRRVAFLAGGERRPATVALTPRELEVAELLEQGLSNKQIAGRLSVEVPTVKNHVHRVLEKIGVGRRAEAAAWLRASGGAATARAPAIDR